MRDVKKGANGFDREHLAKSPPALHRKPNILSSPQKLDSAGIARGWLEMGISPVPLRPRSKEPNGGKGWNTYRADSQNLERFFRRGDNVGGLWGEPSGWIVDVDLDCEEAVRAAEILLPQTFVYGRRQAPWTHYLYVCEGAATHKYQTLTQGTLVEIRSTGTQSVLPPSRHPSGDRYQTERDIAIERISKGRLEQAVQQVAAAALGGRYFPVPGARHDYVHAFTGALAHGNWQESEATRFMSALLSAAGSQGAAREEHLRTVANTLKNFLAGHRVAGWPTLSQWISGEDLKLLRGWLGWKATQLDVAPEQVDLPLIRQIDPKLLEVPGLVGTIAAWHQKKCFTQQPLFDLGVGLAVVALLSQNRYLVSAWDTPLQPYLLLLAPTAAGKDAALTSITEIAEKVGLEKALFSGFQSYHAMLDRIAAPPYAAMWLWDEAARKLRTAARSQGSQDYQILTYLMSLYGKANTVVAGVPGRKQEIAAVKYPFFSVVAAAQPSALLEAITDSDLSLGLINRFILLDAGGKAAMENPKRQALLPAVLEQALQEFARTDHKRGEFTRILYASTSAYSLFRDFERECRERCAAGDGGAEVWGRANQNALVLAGIVTIGVAKIRPQITEATAKWAIAFIRFTSESWAARVEQSASRSEVERGSKYVERIVRNVREFKNRCGKRTPELVLVNRGIMPRSLLIRLCRHIRGKDLDDILSQLIFSDVLGTSEMEQRQVYWIKD